MKRRKVFTFEEKAWILQKAQGGNVSAICREMGMSRSCFYVIKKAYERLGISGLECRPRSKPVMPNAFPESVVRRILEVTERFPSYSSERIRKKIAKEGIIASASGVRKVWKRHGMPDKAGRIAQWRSVFVA